MQRPTLENVRIRSIRDAHHIFYAVACNILPMTMRRLDAEERKAIVSGNVYVWEERVANSEATGVGIERWTDGMRWSPSRVRDEFLFYHQKETASEEADVAHTKWARMIRPRSHEPGSTTPTVNVEGIPNTRPSNDPEKLIKQTYSVTVHLPHSRSVIRKKWHLTAYFTQATVDSLRTIDEQAGVGCVPVPEGMFKCARAGKSKRDTVRLRQVALGDVYTPATTPVGGSPASFTPSSQYAPYPTNEGVVGPSKRFRGLGEGTGRQPQPTLLQSSTHSQYTPMSNHVYSSPPPPPPQMNTSNSLPCPNRHGGHTSTHLPMDVIPSEYPVCVSPHPINTSRPASVGRPNTPATQIWRSQSHSSVSPAPRLQTPSHSFTERDLVPLDCLESATGPRRDPIDDQLLRQFNSLTTTSASPSPGDGVRRQTPRPLSSPGAKPFADDNFLRRADRKIYLLSSPQT